jgi:hypothetical protein
LLFNAKWTLYCGKNKLFLDEMMMIDQHELDVYR